MRSATRSDTGFIGAMPFGRCPSEARNTLANAPAAWRALSNGAAQFIQQPRSPELRVGPNMQHSPRGSRFESYDCGHSRPCHNAQLHVACSRLPSTLLYLAYPNAPPPCDTCRTPNQPSPCSASSSSPSRPSSSAYCCLGHPSS